ncbi:MAG: trehalose-phosphatase [Candidatus Omnitrophota bacterium]
MKYFFTIWDKLKKSLDHKTIFLFLDYDGTLSPIVYRPEAALFPRETKRLLTKLSKISNCKIAIISGRSLKDVKNKVGIKNIIYVGNHGLEIEGQGIKFKKQINPKSLDSLRLIRQGLSKKLLGIKGAFVEDKGLTLSLHYRLVDKKSIPEVKAIFRDTLKRHSADNSIRIKPGKMIFEVRPSINWNKGKAVLWLLNRQKRTGSILPLYVGDDITDEDAFCAIRDKGVTVFIGSPKKSYAQYYLKSTKEVAKLLKQILAYYNIQKQ